MLILKEWFNILGHMGCLFVFISRVRSDNQYLSHVCELKHTYTFFFKSVSEKPVNSCEETPSSCDVFDVRDGKQNPQKILSAANAYMRKIWFGQSKWKSFEYKMICISVSTC